VGGGVAAPTPVLSEDSMKSNASRAFKPTGERTVPCNYCTNSVEPATDSADVSICSECIQATAEEVGI